MEYDQNLLSNDLMIDSVSQTHLKETAMWAKIISIAGFIISSLILIFAIFFGTIISSITPYNSTNGMAAAGVAGIVGIFYGIIALVYFVCSLFQFRFASKMKDALQRNDQETLNLSFQNLKAYYRITGILTIIGLAFFALGLLGIVISLTSGTLRH